MTDISVYISYSKQDKYYALHLAEELERAGITALVDTKILKAGQPWEETLRNALESADVFAVFVSERSAQSQYVRQEVAYALKTKKHIVPISIGGDFTLVSQFGLEQFYSPVLEEPADMQQIVSDIADLVHDDLKSLIEASQPEYQFDAQFVNIILKLIEVPREDVLILYYGGNLSISQAAIIENAVNRAAWIVLPSLLENSDALPLWLTSTQNLFIVNSYSHPESTELLLELSAAAIVFLDANPDAKALLIGLITNALYDAAKFVMRYLRGNMVGVVKEAKWRPLDNTEIPHINDQPSIELRESVETIISNERYFGIRGGRIVWGVERRTVERTLLQG